MQSDKYFQKLEKAIGSKIPVFIKNILKETGYDTEIALRELDESNIAGIEKYMEINRGSLSGTVYENQQPINLLPGHKTTILSIAAHAAERTLKTKGVKRNVNLEDKQPVHDIAPQIITKVRRKLIVKVKTTLAKIKLELKAEDQNICDLEFYSEENATCRYECPACSKKIRCIYYKHWKASNLKLHFKEHSTNAVTIPLNGNENEIDEILIAANNMIKKST